MKPTLRAVAHLICPRPYSPAAPRTHGLKPLSCAIIRTNSFCGTPTSCAAFAAISAYMAFSSVVMERNCTVSPLMLQALDKAAITQHETKAALLRILMFTRRIGNILSCISPIHMHTVDTQFCELTGNEEVETKCL